LKKEPLLSLACGQLGSDLRLSVQPARPAGRHAGVPQAFWRNLVGFFELCQGCLRLLRGSKMAPSPKASQSDLNRALTPKCHKIERLGSLPRDYFSGTLETNLLLTLAKKLGKITLLVYSQFSGSFPHETGS
jgi:hypothetical protein